MKPKYKHERYHLFLGKSEELLKQMPSNSVHAVVCDPPYELGFMGKSWDAAGIAYNVDLWKEVLRVLKPGGYLLAFSGSRTYHRMTCAIEDAGFEIRDQVMWLYGSGFPKSQNISKAIDKAAGAERKVVGTKKHPTSTNRTGSKSPYQAEDSPLNASFDITVPATKEAQEWDGWGTALKPAHEPICVARKPFKGTVVKNVLKHRTGAINIDACRIEHQTINGGNLADNPHLRTSKKRAAPVATSFGNDGDETLLTSQQGRFPANVIHDGSEEVMRGFPITQSGTGAVKRQSSKDKEGNRGAAYGKESRAAGTPMITYGDKGSAARFFHQVNTREGEASAERRYTEKGGTNFAMKPGQRRFDDGSAARFYYCAKASTKDRSEGGIKNDHPTVKPTELMRYLVRLVTPPNGIVLDPFMGSGTKPGRLQCWKASNSQASI